MEERNTILRPYTAWDAGQLWPQMLAKSPHNIDNCRKEEKMKRHSPRKSYGHSDVVRQETCARLLFCVTLVPRQHHHRHAKKRVHIPCRTQLSKGEVQKDAVQIGSRETGKPTALMTTS